MGHFGFFQGLNVADSPAQVDGEEVLGDQALAHHVVEDRGGSRGGDGGEGKTQNTISLHVLHELGLGFAQAKDLVAHTDSAHLERYIIIWIKYSRPNQKHEYGSEALLPYEDTLCR